MTAYDCYRLLVGRGGIDPEYFLRKMKFCEIQPLIDGIQDREKGAWERMRMHAFLVAKLMGDKDHDSPSEFMPFGWEEEVKSDEEAAQDEAALQALLEDCRRRNRVQQEDHKE